LYPKPRRVDSIPKLKRGDPSHVQGFILNKLWFTHCWARNGRHNKHIDLENDLHTGYDDQFKGAILSEARALHKLGFVTIFKSLGRDAICAVFSEEIFPVVLPLINAYLKATGQDPLEPNIREIITGKRSEKKTHCQMRNCENSQECTDKLRIVDLFTELKTRWI